MSVSFRTIAWLSLFGAILAAWAALYGMAQMSGLSVLGIAYGPNAMPLEGWRLLFGMWGLMMLAMMMPTLVPALSVYDDLIRAADGTRAGWIGVALGYFAIWLIFAAGIAAVQEALLRAGVIDLLGRPVSGWLAAMLLIGTGAYQFTLGKQVCHKVCHSPTLWFLGRWSPGLSGGMRMGAGLGSYCVACCWGFMALGFAGGTMNLLWMGLATLFMVLEKLPYLGHAVIRPLGAALIAAGLGVAGWMLATLS